MNSKILTVVSSLWTTSPWAACRINSPKAGSNCGTTVDNVPLGRGWQRNAQLPCSRSRRLKGSRSVFQQSDHAARGRVVFVHPRCLPALRRENLPAKVASQLYVLSDPFGPHPQLRDVLADSVVSSGRMSGARLRAVQTSSGTSPMMGWAI